MTSPILILLMILLLSLVTAVSRSRSSQVGICPLTPLWAWELAWGRAREVFKEIRREEQSQRSKLQVQQQKLGELRLNLAENLGESNLEEYRTLEEQVRKTEMLEQSIIRRMSRQTWLKDGDRCSKYFFALLKSKHAHESMTSITTEDRTTLEQEEQIAEEIHRFYRQLYQQLTITQDERQERRKILELVVHKVPEEDNLLIAREPSMSELTDMVQTMAREKVPGEDGLTVEVLLASWEWTSRACLLVTQEFWESKSLGCKNVAAVVKLLPTTEEKQFLNNWRPIFLLPIIYKIAARILAARIKDLVPKLVDPEQTGFVDGRSITDNILCVKLSQELAGQRNVPSLFYKLDFAKAFDHVQHEFLWETMRQMGFCQNYIELIQGLVGHGSAKVYFNGTATNSFSLERGVRQGCPISPLLFALSTQPLMALLQDEEKKGNLKGLEIPGGRPLLHRLFADDSGITLQASEQNFSNLRVAVARFERVSGHS
ncbi:hypothetical protein R1sor_008927 [Riccia sorocarpa]|uniref:Reverse transcriptase domain-containing protein n=1 Tax=Riccia sorocarpa TaxID=122646 RepID=A0ABD3H4L0_9MARC